MVKNLKVGDRIASIDGKNNKLGQGVLIDLIEKVKCRDVITVNVDTFDREGELILSADSYLECENGELKNIRELCYDDYDLTVLPKVRRWDGSLAILKGFSHDNKS